MLLIFSFGPNFIKVEEVIFYNTFMFCPYPLRRLGVKSQNGFLLFRAA
jgi:hypothetical protein